MEPTTSNDILIIRVGDDDRNHVTELLYHDTRGVERRIWKQGRKWFGKRRWFDGLASAVRRIVEGSAIDVVFEVRGDLDEAIASLRGG